MITDARHLVIRASAGSGKTFQLTNRYLRRLLDGVAPDEILAATFTRKAAGEILERVLSRLAKAAGTEVEAVRLAGELGDNELTAADFRSCLARLLKELHRLRVGTLDSFFARLATNFTLELGLPPGWKIVEPLHDQQLRTRAIATILREERTAEVVRITNLLAKGDAARSVSSLIRQTVNKFYDLYRETDANAWRRLPELNRLTSEQLEDAIAALETAELPAHKTIAKSRTADVESARANDWGAFIECGIGGKLLNDETKYCGKQLSDGLIAIYRRLLDHARAVLIQELAHQTLATWQLLERFDVEYQKLKRTQRSLRFDDVTHRLRERLASQDMQGLAYRLDAHIAHLLLDEFQDTSPSQWQVLRPFAARITASEETSSFFCVGDAKQAIYGWRGGVAEIFDAVDDHLAGLSSLPLSESYRSSPAVIESVNRLFAGLSNHSALDDAEDRTVRDWSESFPLHTTAKHDLPGYACVVSSAVQQSEDGKRVDDMLPSVARRVGEIVKNTPWASVGVLLRRNDEVAEVMNLLRQMDVPASEEGGNPITDSAAVLTILSLLTLADHPGDTVSRYHVASSPLGESLAFTGHGDDASAANLAAEIRQSLMHDGYGPALERWTDAITPACTSRDVMRLGQLVELGYRFDAEATLRPTDFVRFVEQERFPDPSADRVRVMTVHAAKGLEFDIVVAPLTERQLTGQTPPFVAGRHGPTGPIDRVCLYRKEAIQKLLPDEMQQAFATAKCREIHETLCRLYVAVTRPVHALHVIIPASADNEKKLPRCPAGLVRAALTDGRSIQPEAIVYENGHREWFRRIPASAERDSCIQKAMMSPKSAAPVDRLDVRLAAMTSGRGRGLARVAPSRHQKHQPVPLARMLQTPNAAALRRGTLIHAWFEQISWLDAGRPPDGDLRRLAANHGFSADDAESMLAQFSLMLRQPQLVRVLSQSSYSSAESLPFDAAVNESLLRDDVTLQVRQELPIAARLGGELTTGSIDRLVLIRRGGIVLAADIVDFKTDDVCPDREPEWSQRIALYQEQLTAYADAVARIYTLPRDHIAARLAYVKPQVVVNVELNET